MSNHSIQCCGEDCKHVKVESITLEDGRRAERHICVDADGREVVKIFEEEKRPLKLSKQIVREYKQVVASEVHEDIRDGAVVRKEVRSVEPDAPLQVRDRIAVKDHDRVVGSDYAKKEDVTEAVVAAMSVFMDHHKPVVHEAPAVGKPLFSAQSVVEENVEKSKKNGQTFNIVMGVLAAVQLAFFGYLYFT